MAKRQHRKDRVEFLPLGGLGVIGMNNMLMKCGDTSVLLDSGVMFPSPEQPGVDLVLPNLDLLGREAPQLDAIVLTHGHEDHIGAVPYVLARHNVPVYGGRFTLALVHEKLVEHGLSGRAQLIEVAPGQNITIGCFRFGFLRVTHSIPDCMSLAIETPVGRVLFTGDFKIDRALPDGTRFDEDGFRKLGDDGVLLMMSDSTNAENPGWTRSEGEVAKALVEAISKAPGRVLVGLFSSNLYRVKAVVNAARESGRYCALFGRSLDRYRRVAAKNTRLDIRGADLIDQRDIDLYDDDELVMICTGSQGEMRATLRRVASGTHNHIRLRPTDTLLLSSRRIPGNERPIYEMVDDFARLGAAIVHPGMEPTLHASGHARADELGALISWVRPKFFVPVHGTHAFMKQHAAIAEANGVGSTVVVENGQRFQLTTDGITITGEVNAHPWYADGKIQGDDVTLGLKGRRELMRQGCVAVAARFNGKNNHVQVTTTGLAATDELCEQLADELGRFMDETKGRPDPTWLSEELRRRARRFFKRTIGKRPVAMVLLDGV